MNFKIEHIVTINKQAYLIVNCADTKGQFELSGNCFLGEFQIENWYNIPIAKDENGKHRLDQFAFVLKNEKDKLKIEIGEVLTLSK